LAGTTTFIPENIGTTPWAPEFVTVAEPGTCTHPLAAVIAGNGVSKAVGWYQRSNVLVTPPTIRLLRSVITIPYAFVLLTPNDITPPVADQKEKDVLEVVIVVWE
jgi:hypothetical protein